MDVTNTIDLGLKGLFTHPEMVQSLLEGFVKQSWISELDFSSLHTLNVNHASDSLRERDNDIIWKIRVKGEWLYLILLLEFQSRNDKFMAVRLITYIGLVYEDLIKSTPDKSTLDELPPVFPLVFYTGRGRWTAPLNMKACFSKAIPANLMKYQPQIEYLLLDVGRLNLNNYESAKGNPTYSLIELEKARNMAQAKEAIEKASQNLKGKVDSLRRSFHVYVTKVLRIPEKYPDPEIIKLCEGNMLAERVQEWYEEQRQQGKIEGKIEGEQEALKRTISMIWERIHSSKLPKDIQQKFENASTEELEQFLNKILHTHLVPEV